MKQNIQWASRNRRNPEFYLVYGGQAEATRYNVWQWNGCDQGFANSFQ